MLRRKYPKFKTKKKSCEGKKRYTRKEAALAARSLHFQTGERLGSYKCTFCNHFHVGHTPYAIRQIIDNK